MAELAVAQIGARLYHLRQEQGRHELDLLGELPARRIEGIEVKAAAVPAGLEVTAPTVIRRRLTTPEGEQLAEALNRLIG